MMRHAGILLVEDNEGDIELTRVAFEEGKLSCHLSVAHDGAEALDFLMRRGAFEHASTPDLILLDINMPRMDGIEFLKVVKQHAKLKTIPVVMLTSSDAENDIRTCYELHANCYIIKPSGLEKFIEVARQVESFWAGLVQLPLHGAEG